MRLAKHVLFLVVMVSLILLSISPFCLSQNIPDTITGKQVYGESHISIIIDGDGPKINILSPKERYYHNFTSIDLNYSVYDISGISKIWYNLNDGGNISIESNISLEMNEGEYLLSLFANDSIGNQNSSTIKFFVNNSKFIVIHDEFIGETTNFESLSNEELMNLSNMTLETNYGQIIWLENINLKDDLNSEDNETNLGTISILYNSLWINETQLPNLNKKAKIQFKNLIFNNPRILKNQEVCPESDCKINYYSEGVLDFEVNGFSFYSAEETSEENETSGPGRTGLNRLFSNENFFTDKEKILISLKQGETKKQNLVIKNAGKKKIKINMSIFGINNFLKLNENEFELLPEEFKTINMEFFAREDKVPDLYVGKLIIEGEKIKKEIPLAIEVESREPLFDVKVEIPSKLQNTAPGEDLLTTIKIFNVEKTGKVDVILDYIIKNEQDKTVFSEQETIAVESQASFVKELKIPENTALGKYFFFVRVIHDNQSASSFVGFSVSQKPFFENLDLIYIISLFIILALAIILVIYFELNRLKRSLFKKLKIDENILAKEKIIKFNKFDKGG